MWNSIKYVLALYIGVVLGALIASWWIYPQLDTQYAKGYMAGKLYMVDILMPPVKPMLEDLKVRNKGLKKHPND